MAEATNPIATASNPRVWDAFMAGVRWHVSRPLASEESALRAAQEFASAPSPDPAGGGGDLGELERLSAAATPGPWAYRPEHLDDWGYIRSLVADSRGPKGKVVAISRGDEHDTHDAHRAAGTDPYEPNGRFIVALVNAYRSGKLVASTGSGKEETKGERTITLPALKADQIAYLRDLQASLQAETQYDTETRIGPAGPAAGFDGYGSQARPLEPQPSPPQTPVDPQMTMEEAADIVGKLPFGHSPQETARFLRMEAERWIGHRRDDCLARAARIEAALAALAPSDAPSTTEADR